MKRLEPSSDQLACTPRSWLRSKAATLQAARLATRRSLPMTTSHTQTLTPPAAGSEGLQSSQQHSRPFGAQLSAAGTSPTRTCCSTCSRWRWPTARHRHTKDVQAAVGAQGHQAGRAPHGPDDVPRHIHLLRPPRAPGRCRQRPPWRRACTAARASLVPSRSAQGTAPAAAAAPPPPSACRCRCWTGAAGYPASSGSEGPSSAGGSAPLGPSRPAPRQRSRRSKPPGRRALPRSRRP